MYFIIKHSFLSSISSLVIIFLVTIASQVIFAKEVKSSQMEKVNLPSDKDYLNWTKRNLNATDHLMFVAKGR